MNGKRVAAVALGLCISVVLVGAGFAAENEREQTMKMINGSVKALSTMAKSGTFDAAVAQKEGNAIAGDFDHFKDLFPEGSEKQDDKALPTIWSDRAGFEQQHAISAAFGQAAGEGGARRAGADDDVVVLVFVGRHCVRVPPRTA